jgi:hypothetical protein
MSDQTRFILNEKDIPTTWYNIQADLPEPVPAVLNPGTQQPIGPEDLAPLFPMGLIEQEVSTEREIDIPGEVIDIYHSGRTGLLQQGGGREAHHHRDGGRAVGLGAGDGLPILRHRLQGLHGARELRPEALSQSHDGDVRSRGVAEPE